MDDGYEALPRSAPPVELARFAIGKIVARKAPPSALLRPKRPLRQQPETLQD
jgi:hypothetical protein